MTANADTGATRADTTGNGATSHDATNQSGTMCGRPRGPTVANCMTFC